MDKSANNSGTAHQAAHQAGHWVGCVVLRYLRFERTMSARMTDKGVNPVLCCWTFRIMKLVLISLALYVSFWIAVACFVIWLFVGMAELGLFANSSPDDRMENGMRSGLMGFGYYIGGARVDGKRLDEED